MTDHIRGRIAEHPARRIVECVDDPIGIGDDQPLEQGVHHRLYAAARCAGINYAAFITDQTPARPSPTLEILPSSLACQWYAVIEPILSPPLRSQNRRRPDRPWMFVTRHTCLMP